MITARPICFVLLRQPAPNARSFALLNAGSSIAARMAMMAMTTSNSIRVNPHPGFDLLIRIPALVFILIFLKMNFGRSGFPAPLPPNQAPHKAILRCPDQKGRCSLKNIAGLAGSMVMLVDVTLPLPDTSTQGVLNKLVWLCRIHPALVGQASERVLPDRLDRIAPASGLICRVTSKLPVPEL